MRKDQGHFLSPTLAASGMRMGEVDFECDGSFVGQLWWIVKNIFFSGCIYWKNVLISLQCY